MTERKKAPAAQKAPEKPARAKPASPTAPARDAKGKFVGKGTGPIRAATDAAKPNLTPGKTLRELEQVRRLAIRKKQPTAALSAALAKAKVAGVLTESSEPDTASSTAPASTAIDTDAVRRVAYIMALAATLPPAQENVQENVQENLEEKKP